MAVCIAYAARIFPQGQRQEFSAHEKVPVERGVKCGCGTSAGDWRNWTRAGGKVGWGGGQVCLRIDTGFTGRWPIQQWRACVPRKARASPWRTPRRQTGLD